MDNNTEASSITTTLVSQPSAFKLKDITKEIELYIFRIPKGLLNIKDLVNKEINIGKKSSKVTVNGNKYDFTVRQLEGQESLLQPWLSNSKGVLKPSSVSVTAEVRARIHLAKPSVGKFLEGGLEQLAPVVHMPPELPCRDFFGTRREDSAGKAALSDNSSKKKSKRKSIAVCSGGDGVSGTPTSDKAASSRKRKSLSLEELTPQLQQKPFKKKKQDKLVASFKGVYEDICATPSVGAGSKTKGDR